MHSSRIVALLVGIVVVMSYQHEEACGMRPQCCQSHFRRSVRIQIDARKIPTGVL